MRSFFTLYKKGQDDWGSLVVIQQPPSEETEMSEEQKHIVTMITMNQTTPITEHSLKALHLQGTHARTTCQCPCTYSEVMQ